MTVLCVSLPSGGEKPELVSGVVFTRTQVTCSQCRLELFLKLLHVSDWLCRWFHTSHIFTETLRIWLQITLTSSVDGSMRFSSYSFSSPSRFQINLIATFHDNTIKTVWLSIFSLCFVTRAFLKCYMWKMKGYAFHPYTGHMLRS